MLASALGGCLFRKDYPPQPVVAEVALEGQQALDPKPLLDGLATAESSRFLGLWDGVAFEYEVYDPDLLAKDLERVERYLRQRGYYEAKVVAARVIALDEHRVRVEIRIHEGAPVTTASITPKGLETLPIEVAAACLRDNPLRVGRPFDEADYDASKTRILRVLRDSGYAFAAVTGEVEIDVARHEARVVFEVTPGEPATYGPIRILGLKELPEDRVRQHLAIQQGASYSQSDLDDARRALVNLGVFSSVQVRPERSRARGNAVPIRISVEETELRTVRLGGGVLIDSLQLSNHVTLGWEDRNFLQGLRRFSIDGKPGLVYYPTRIGDLSVPDRGLYQQQINATLRQPAFVEGRTTGFVSTNLSLYPLLYADTAPDEGIVGFFDVRASAGVERAFWGHRLFATPSHNWQLAMPFDYRSLTIGRRVAASDELLEDLMISYPELVLNLDLRDDPLETREGALFSVSVQRAAHIFGSDVSDLRLRPEARFYVPISPKVTFATRFTTGFLFAGDYGHTLDPGGGPFTDSELAHDQQKLLFRGFFSGGPNSNRGYPLRGVGPHGEVRFLSRNVDCGAQPGLRECNRPLGGVSLWEASAEVRFVILGPFRGVLFLDGSDVARDLRIDLLAPHLSAGGGFRYGTPIGPVRLDVGYRVPFAQDFKRDVPEGNPRNVFGLPIAIHVTLGEAF